MLSKNVYAQMMETLRRSKNPTTVVSANGEVHKCMFTISICSSQCNYSKKRQQFYRLVSFAQNTDVIRVEKR